MLDLISCRELVKEALQEAGWRLKASPARFDGETLVILDFEAVRENLHAYFVVYCADAVGRIPDITVRIGQYLVYQEAIHKAQPEAVLYLAMPEDVYERVVTASVRAVIQAHGIEVFTVKVVRRLPAEQALAQRVGQVVRNFSGEWTGTDGKAVSFMYCENVGAQVYCIIAPATLWRQEPDLIVMARVVGEQVILDQDKTGSWLRVALEAAGVEASRFVQPV